MGENGGKAPCEVAREKRKGTIKESPTVGEKKNKPHKGRSGFRTTSGTWVGKKRNSKLGGEPKGGQVVQVWGELKSSSKKRKKTTEGGGK